MEHLFKYLVFVNAPYLDSNTLPPRTAEHYLTLPAIIFVLADIVLDQDFLYFVAKAGLIFYECQVLTSSTRRSLHQDQGYW